MRVLLRPPCAATTAVAGKGMEQSDAQAEKVFGERSVIAHEERQSESSFEHSLFDGLFTSLQFLGAHSLFREKVPAMCL